MLTIDEAQSAIQDAFAPLVCRIERGRYNESLSVGGCDAGGDIVEDLGKLTQSLFRRGKQFCLRFSPPTPYEVLILQTNLPS